jgi:hypothetical protein
LIDVAIAIDMEETQVTLRTRSGGYYQSGGQWVPGAVTDTVFDAAVQPADAKQLKDLPEGLRGEARYLLWTRTPLSLDDLIVYEGDTFRIMHVWNRQRDGGYTKAALGMTRHED